jgi:cob(I)alamin adenosyltransferase
MGYRLSKIYTRKGDDGSTSLDGKNRLSKSDLRIEVIGTIDELNCVIGMVLAHDNYSEDVRSFFTQIQHDLFNLGGELCPPHHPAITEEKITLLENKIDKWNEDLPPLKEFILPGGNAASATCHLARAICRRAERHLVALQKEESFSPALLHYLNRLSDVLFVAARILTKEAHGEEVLWQSGKK